MNVLPRSVTSFIVGSVVGFSICSSIAPKEKFSIVQQRLHQAIHIENNQNLVFRSEKNGVKIYGLTKGKLSDGLAHARVAQAVINAPINDIAEIWWRHHERQTWDKENIVFSELIQEKDSNTRIVHIQAKNKPLISSRDFVFTIYRYFPDSLTSIQSINPKRVLFTQVDAGEEVPHMENVVRAEVNSMLLLESIDANTTKANYAIEMDIKGWIPRQVSILNWSFQMIYKCIFIFCDKLDC